MIVTESREFQSKLHAFYRDLNETQEISVNIVVKNIGSVDTARKLSSC